MSVICCRVPDFLITLAVRQCAELTAQPVLLTGPDGSVWAVSDPARQRGAHAQMALRQALARCPEARVQPLDLQIVQQGQESMLGVLNEWRLPVESLGWGMAYVDLHSVANAPDDVRQLAADLGRKVRKALGAELQPALGWDSGKFTARAAAIYTRPGSLRLVPRQKEISFLAPLPITVLPLPPQNLQQLHWLGIRTLGQYAKLPSNAVVQRFGRVGKLAQRWAQGRDDRPVHAGATVGSLVIAIDIDPPTGLLTRLIGTLMDALEPRLRDAGERLRGWRRLQVDLHFVDGSERQIALTFAAATAEKARVRASLTSRLTTLNWPDEVSSVLVRVVEEAELPIQQLSLFPTADERATSQQRHLAGLVGKYGPLFLRGVAMAPNHPVSGRRFGLNPRL